MIFSAMGADAKVHRLAQPHPLDLFYEFAVLSVPQPMLLMLEQFKSSLLCLTTSLDNDWREQLMIPYYQIPVLMLKLVTLKSS